MMRLSKKLARSLAVGIGCLALLAVGFYFVAIHSLNSAFAEADFAPLITGIKAAAAKFVVAQQSAKLTSVQHASSADGPVASASDAKLFDVWHLSGRIAQATLESTVPGSWVHSTEDEPYLAGGDRHDPWKHSLCVLRRGNTVAVISGGPKALNSPACLDISMSEGDLSKLPRGRLFETPGGNFLFVLRTDKNESGMPPS